jgi:vitamin B12 transporter
MMSFQEIAMFLAIVLLSTGAAAQDKPEILVTASRAPETESNSAASATVIDGDAIERLGEPMVDSLIRLTPSAAVETSGPAGSFAEVRIRGAEANHTLLFIDGIRANDPASNDTPRFELLNADLASRIEVVRGPQSALWGSDAIGGVIAVNGVDAAGSNFAASAEGGSFGFARGSASTVLASPNGSIEGAVGYQRATGIDSFDGNGDKDGFENLSVRLRGTWQIAPSLSAGVSAFSLNGRSEYDGIDLLTFLHADTLDSTRNRLGAASLWLSAGDSAQRLSGTLATSYLASSNRNFLDEEEINRTGGERWTASGQLQYRFATGAADHIAIVAFDDDREGFHARDIIYFGASDQDRHRSHDAVTAEWRTELAPVAADVAVRHDAFSAFKDTTTVRASALVALGGGISAAASYSEGIAQPTLFDLYGFFPGSFVGNADLKPESSKGFEVSLRYRRGRFDASLTGYRQRLRDEIVDVFDPVTFISSTVNRDEVSRRSGIEAQVGWSAGPGFRISANYAWLKATEPGATPSLQLCEIRRPEHSGAIAVDGRRGRLTYGASLAYVGARGDTNFDVFPAEKVRLKPYWLAGARLAWSVTRGLQLFVRGSNLLDESYQDVFGYRTEGRAVYVGVRLSGD